MFSLEGRNKLGIISSFLYFVGVFICQVIIFITSVSDHFYAYDYGYVFFNEAVAVIGLFMVFALVKDFFKDRNLGTVFIGIFLFFNLISPIVPMMGISSYYYNYIVIVSLVLSVLLMSLRLFKSPNIGKIVGLIGFVYIPMFIFKDGVGFTSGVGEQISIIHSLWTFVLGMIPAGIYFSYFLFYEKA